MAEFQLGDALLEFSRDDVLAVRQELDESGEPSFGLVRATRDGCARVEEFETFPCVWLISDGRQELARLGAGQEARWVDGAQDALSAGAVLGFAHPLADRGDGFTALDAAEVKRLRAVAWEDYRDELDSSMEVDADAARDEGLADSDDHSDCGDFDAETEVEEMEAEEMEEDVVEEEVRPRPPRRNHLRERNNEEKARKQAQVATRATYVRAKMPLFKPFLSAQEIRAWLPSLPREQLQPGTAIDTALLPSAADLVQPIALREQPHCIAFGQMRGYQLEGLSYLVNRYDNGVGAILGDEMGLGKTLQTISFLAYLMEARRQRGPHLVVAPLSVLSSWREEFRRWCPSLDVHVFHGPEKERKRIAAQLTVGSFDVCITTFEMVCSDPNFFQKIYWHCMVLDEAHRIKNEETRAATTLRRVRCTHITLLTGTLLQNNLHELWSLLNFAFPDVFVKSTVFDEAFSLAEGKASVQDDVLLAARRLLEELMLRREKVEVERDLPKKTELKVFVPLSAMQRFWYKRMLLKDTRLLEALEEGSEYANSGADWQKLMGLLMQLRKCCNHPYLFPGAEPASSNLGEHLVEASGKLQVLDQILVKLHQEGRKVLLFSLFTRMLDVLEDYCHLRGYSYRRLDGSTPRVRRQVDIKQFNDPGSGIFLYLLSTRAGGLGITLTGADTVVHVDSDWNPQVDLQAQDRAHRIGQTQDVQVLRLIAEGTVEERVVLRAERKLYLSAVVTGKLNATQGESLSKKELASMVTFGASKILAAASEEEEAQDGSLEAVLARSRQRQEQQSSLVAQAQPSFDADAKPLDVRQFMGTNYSSVTTTGDIAQQWALEVANKKRRSKSRIVDCQGVPVLRETMAHDKVYAVSLKRKRGMEHQKHCILCWEEAAPGAADVRVCKGCPRTWHASCPAGAPGRGATASCLQHRCAVCARPAAEAGGALFRCTSCPIAYCETDLQTEDYAAASVTDRHEVLEALGYARDNVLWMHCSEECKVRHAEEVHALREAQASPAKKAKSLWMSLSAESRAQLEAIGRSEETEKEQQEPSLSLGEIPTVKQLLKSSTGRMGIVKTLYAMLYDDSASTEEMKAKIAAWTGVRGVTAKDKLAACCAHFFNELQELRPESACFVANLFGLRVRKVTGRSPKVITKKVAQMDMVRQGELLNERLALFLVRPTRHPVLDLAPLSRAHTC